MEDIKNKIPEGQEQEYEEAVKEAEQDQVVTFEHTLRKPLMYNNQEYKTLHFNFENLSGEDSLNVEAELEAQGIMVMVPTFSGQYLIRVAAKACLEHIGVDGFKKISIKDYNRIRSRTRNFFISSEQ